MNSNIKFFLGANSNIDFISYFKQLQEQSDSMQLLILKGGPGSGKSSLMKRIARYGEEKGHKLELIPCASDPHSLDAIIDYSANFAMMDGTAPHIEDPSLPGVLHHIIYTGDLWDTNKLLKKKDTIQKLNQSIAHCHKGGGAYIKSAAALLMENMRYASLYMDKKEAGKFVLEKCKALPKGDAPKERTCLLSAVSVGEVKVFSQTVCALAEKIYIIDDKWGTAADYILKSIKRVALLGSMSIIHCPCSLIPHKTDHIILPDASVAFVTQNSTLKLSHGEIIDADAFYRSMPLVSHMEARLSDSLYLLEKAGEMVSDAKLLHDELEAFYIEAMNFDGMDKIFNDIIKRFYR